nr:hypothetical protein [Xanthomonas oryzae]
MNLSPTTLIAVCREASPSWSVANFLYLWLRNGGSVWLHVAHALRLATFVWLLSCIPDAQRSRDTGAYGGV